MAFKVIVTCIENDFEKMVMEKTFDQKIVKIGRTKASDIKLVDPLIGRNHAEIRMEGDKYYVVDLESRNGTSLNGSKLSGEPGIIRHNDHIGIGSFMIYFNVINTPFKKWVDPELGLTNDDSLLGEASHRHQEMITSPDIFSEINMPDVAGNMPDIIDPAVLGLIVEGESVAREEEIEDSIATPIAEALLADSFKEAITVPESVKIPDEANEVALYTYKVLNQLADEFSGGKASINSKEDADLFVSRIKSSLGVLLSDLELALKGRKEFEHEFDAEATRIFEWDVNPVKHNLNKNELYAYLFDWTGAESIEKVTENLDDAFKDVILHQVGMMFGFKAGINKLLEELSPEKVAEGLESKGAFGKLAALKQLRDSALWELYKEKHEELTDNKTRTFEEFLGPEIAKAYLETHKHKNKKGKDD